MAIRLNCLRIENRCIDTKLMLHLTKRMQQMMREMLNTTRLQKLQSQLMRILRRDAHIKVIAA